MAAKPFRVTTMDSRTLRLAGELDMASVSKLQAELELRPHGTSTAFDLAELTFLDSSGLNAFSQHAKTLNGEGPLVLENVPDSIADLLRLVGFDQLSTIDIRR
jgi:anti-anti-sigma factor